MVGKGRGRGAVKGVVVLLTDEKRCRVRRRSFGRAEGSRARVGRKQSSLCCGRAPVATSAQPRCWARTVALHAHLVQFPTGFASDVFASRQMLPRLGFGFISSCTTLAFPQLALSSFFPLHTLH